LILPYNKGTALAGPQEERKGERALAPAMAHPARNAAPANILNPSRVFFVTTKTSMGRRLLQSERNAGLLIDVLRSLFAEHRFKILDFVVMPDHIHLLIEVSGAMTIERAMQLIKGRFSHRLSHEFGYKGEVWQRGFTEEQVMNKESFEAHRAYIAGNPVKAGLAAAAGEFPFCFGFLARMKQETVGRGQISRG
jgi:putative transposase